MKGIRFFLRFFVGPIGDRFRVPPPRRRRRRHPVCFRGPTTPPPPPLLWSLPPHLYIISGQLQRGEEDTHTRTVYNDWPVIYNAQKPPLTQNHHSHTHTHIHVTHATKQPNHA